MLSWWAVGCEPTASTVCVVANNAFLMGCRLPTFGFNSMCYHKQCFLDGVANLQLQTACVVRSSAFFMSCMLPTYGFRTCVNPTWCKWWMHDEHLQLVCLGTLQCKYICFLDWPDIKIWLQQYSLVLHRASRTLLIGCRLPTYSFSWVITRSAFSMGLPTYSFKWRVLSQVVLCWWAVGCQPYSFNSMWFRM